VRARAAELQRRPPRAHDDQADLAPSAGSELGIAWLACDSPLGNA
jgi:hypothetical protein